MRIQKKTVSLILLSPREVDLLLTMVEEARDGKTVHYSERQTGPNQFFGLSVDERHDEKYNPRNNPKYAKPNV